MEEEMLVLEQNGTWDIFNFLGRESVVGFT